MKKLLLFLTIFSLSSFAVNSTDGFIQTTATTATPVSTSVGPVSSICCEPCSGNSGTYIYWGASNVSSTISLRLEKGQDLVCYDNSPQAKMSNEVELSTKYVLADTTGDKICCSYVKSKE